MMNILLLGSGGREHAIAWRVSQSSKCNKLFIAPGNAGTGKCGTNIPLSLNDFNSIRVFVIDNDIGLVVVGPEEPLVKGLGDFFLNDEDLKRILFLGPSAKGAQLEGSKDFAKEFMMRHDIPTAAYKTFKGNETEYAKQFIRTLNPPYVLKADGLAAGKGVIIVSTTDEADAAIEQMLGKSLFGEAGNKIVIEEFLSGIELSVFVLTDGKSFVVLPEAKDYKRIGEKDTGLNTGGMGAVSPVPFAGKNFMEKVKNQIILPTIKGLQIENIPYRGFIFIGLMMVNNNPFVIEYNVRMGDPESEVVFPRIKSDIVELLASAAGGILDKHLLSIDERTAVTVMLVSGGYPGKYEQGKEISFQKQSEDSILFHAGTEVKNNSIITNGGRVMSVTSYGKSINEARKRCYEEITKIKFEGMYYRRDIGSDLMEKN